MSTADALKSLYLSTAGSEQFDLSRLRVLARDKKLLVMDRVSGRWVLLPRDFLEALQLLGAAGESLPAVLSEHVDQLRALLVRENIGVSGSERQYTDLSTIIIKLTNACNLACAYCYDFETIEKAKRLHFETANQALKEAIDICAGKLWVILHGGEPMLVWDLVEKIVLAAETYSISRGVKLSFTGQTNLTRLTERIVEFSIGHNIEWGISVDGPSAIHDRLRAQHNGEGSHYLFLRFMEQYPLFVRRCGIMSTITTANQHLLLETARYFRDLGMPSWDWSLFQPIGRGRNTDQFNINIDVLLASWHELFDAVIDGEFNGFTVLPVKKYIDNFIHGPGSNMCMRPQCGAARDLLSISSDGTIEACDCIDPLGPLGKLGNLASSTLADARLSSTAELIRSRNVNHLDCGQCIWFGICGGTCMAHAGGVHEIWEDGCSVALAAFDRISCTLASSTAVQSYLASIG